MMLEVNKAYIQKNPLFGRKVICFDRIRESIWDWDLCDATVVTIDKEPGVVRVKGVAITRVSDEQKSIAMRQETLGKIIELLSANGIIDSATYDATHMMAYAEFYEQYSRQQMEHVTDVIDVHK